MTNCDRPVTTETPVMLPTNDKSFDKSFLFVDDQPFIIFNAYSYE